MGLGRIGARGIEPIIDAARLEGAANGEVEIGGARLDGAAQPF